MTAATSPRAWGRSSAWNQLRVLTMRSIHPMLRDPRLLLLSLVQPLLMLVLFSQVFQAVSETPVFPRGISYTDYLVPAIFVLTATGAGVQAAGAFAEDLRNGILIRFRLLPVHRLAVLLARTFAELVRISAQLVITAVLAVLLFGFSPSGGLFGIAAAVAVAAVFGWSLSWIFLALAANLRSLQKVQAAGVLVMFPLMFGSNAYMPIEGLPEWLRGIASVNPLSTTITAVRTLAAGVPSPGVVLHLLLLVTAMATIGAWSANRGFRHIEEV